MSVVSRIALALVIIGGINWGLIGFFQFDLVASLFGGQDAWFARVVYSLVGISAIVCLGLLFKPSEEMDTIPNQPGKYVKPDLRTEFGEEADFRKEREQERRNVNHDRNGMD